MTFYLPTPKKGVMTRQKPRVTETNHFRHRLMTHRPKNVRFFILLVRYLNNDGRIPLLEKDGHQPKR